MIVLENYGLHNSPNYINVSKFGNSVDTTGGHTEMVLIVAYWVETEAEKLTAPLRNEKELCSLRICYLFLICNHKETS